VTSLGGEVADLADQAGLHLDGWQRHVLTGAFGVLNDGRWSAFEVGVVVPRQNGKGSILEAVELAGLFLFGERMILHSAHELKTSMEAFRRILDLVTGVDWLRKQVKRVTRSHGDEGIELLNGNRLRFTARSTGAGRGFTGDRIVMDEAYNLGPEAMAALLPTLSARPNPQLWYASSAGMSSSTQLHAVRARGLKGVDPSLAYFEWSAPDRADPDDPAVWRQANPALGIRITEQFVGRERAAMPEAEFLRERLGVWDDPRNATVIPAETWAACLDLESIPSGEIAFAVDATPDRSAASIAVACRRNGDGRWHVEVIDSRRGVAWVADRTEKLLDRWGRVPVLIDAGGPAASLLPDLAGRHVDVTVIGSRDYTQACGLFYDAVVGDELRHLGQTPLDVAVAAARKRTIGDAWGWARKDLTDISPLVAATLAVFGASRRAAEPVRTGRAHFFS
jgi:phage terminase large subunit-like protein